MILMNQKSVMAISVAGVALVLLLGGTATTIILFNNGYAQSTKLGEPIFVEKGGDTIKREIGPNTTQYTFTSNGKMNGNIEYSKAGEYISIAKGNNMTFDHGHGVLTTKDGSETANYTFIEVSNGTAYQGASAYSTNSTGKLSTLNNILVIFKGPTNESGNYALKQWPWK